MKRIGFPRSAYNAMSIFGGMLALVTGITFVVFLFVMGRHEHANPYIGMFVYMALPPVALSGLLLIPIGMFRKKRRVRTQGEELAPVWPKMDLNDRAHRNAFFLFVFGTVTFLLISAVGGYQAYHFTESVSFCGTMCHSVMHPEYTAYQSSPHAKVACVACHVGPGAGWYAKSKLSGLYQVYAVTADIFPRPIPTPIKNLRPAQETCEQCHWPEKFFGAQQRQFNHYMYNEENTSWPINILIKTGGGDPQTGQTAGIHWHMNIGVAIEYVARDELREDIPWIRVTDRLTGRVTVYQDEDNPLTEEELATATHRRMDCMDCHNRPSHKFPSPDLSIDRAILTGKIDRSLPEIKRVAVEAMAQPYDKTEDAMQHIASAIPDFYRDEYPEIFEEKRVVIDQAVLAVQQQFRNTIFPEMKVRWENYRDNIGHFIYPGCMRCHAGNKVSEEGWVISRDCNSCHTILSQGSGVRAHVASTPEGLEFEHPEDIDEAWREMGCYECHMGTQP